MVTKQALYDAVDARESAIVSTLRELVQIDTENPPGRNYDEGAAFLADALSRRG